MKIGCLVAGMAAGADSIDDMDVLRHGAMAEVFAGLRAPSTVGSFLRSFTWGNVLQFGKVSRELLTELACLALLLLGAGVLAFVDIDSTQRRVYGPEKQGTAFGSRKKVQAVTARLIVRRIWDLSPRAQAGQGELFPAWRYHAILTDSPFTMLQAEEQHRDHAVIEQVLADLTGGPLAHAPSGMFTANAAWLVLAAIAHNLTRADGVLASARHARAKGATIRADLINLATRIARHGRAHLTLHLPSGWHRQAGWLNLFQAACGPPRTRAA